MARVDRETELNGLDKHHTDMTNIPNSWAGPLFRLRKPERGRLPTEEKTKPRRTID